MFNILLYKYINIRMFEYGFEEDVDFTSFLTESSGGRPSLDYALSLDCAKEISMIQRSEKGKIARSSKLGSVVFIT